MELRGDMRGAGHLIARQSSLPARQAVVMADIRCFKN